MQGCKPKRFHKCSGISSGFFFFWKWIVPVFDLVYFFNKKSYDSVQVFFLQKCIFFFWFGYFFYKTKLSDIRFRYFCASKPENNRYMFGYFYKEKKFLLQKLSRTNKILQKVKCNRVKHRSWTTLDANRNQKWTTETYWNLK